MGPEGPPIVLEGFSLCTENNAYIPISPENEAFLHRMHEFNRDSDKPMVMVMGKYKWERGTAIAIVNRGDWRINAGGKNDEARTKREVMGDKA